MSDPPLPPPIHNILLTIPRTASHLLTKLLNLSSQSKLHRPTNSKDGYFFLPAVVARFKNNLIERPISSWSSVDKQTLRSALQTSFDDYISLINEAELKNRATYIKEHLNWLLDPDVESLILCGAQAQSQRTRDFEVAWTADAAEGQDAEQVILNANVTYLPTAFLLHRVKPTFLIRHPALVFSSALRTSIDMEGLDVVVASERTQRWECTYKWTLSLYRLYADTPSFDRATCEADVQFPIILDASDLGNEELVKKYARAIGLDDGQVRFQWSVAHEEELQGQGDAERRMKSTIMASTGVDKKKLGGGELDVEALEEEWKDEFGAVLADRMARLVRDSMSDYLLLKELRLHVEPEMSEI